MALFSTEKPPICLVWSISSKPRSSAVMLRRLIHSRGQARPYDSNRGSTDPAMQEMSSSARLATGAREPPGQASEVL